ncbi:mechanosensitive channel protein, partial [Escherichia coli]|nr:mechanosensitive channel protein [Escherichia coli]
ADHSLAFFSLFIRAFALVWHWLACAYFVVLFFFSLFDPGNSLKFMMGATLQSLAIIGGAALVSGILSRWIAKTITLSPATQRNYPELQKRLNGWISASLKAARILTVCVAIMLLLSAWGLFDFREWLHNDAGQKTVDVLIRIALILFFSAIGWTVLASLIENRLASDIHGRPLPSARARTLLTLFRNVLAIVISTITVMIVLSQVGLNIAPLLAGAGALGLAISFGAQTLVKDVITGVFIQFENGMNTGEYVTVSGITGTVERMTIRSIGLRDDYGVYHIVPYSSITTLANYAREFGVYRANYTVSRDEDIDRVNE